MNADWPSKPEAEKRHLHTVHMEHYLRMDFGAKCLVLKLIFPASLILCLSPLFYSVRRVVVAPGWVGDWVIKTEKTFTTTTGT